MTCIYHHAIVRNSFTALETVCSALPLPAPGFEHLMLWACGPVLCLRGPVWCSVLPSVGADGLGPAGGPRDVCVGLAHVLQQADRPLAART